LSRKRLSNSCDNDPYQTTTTAAGYYEPWFKSSLDDRIDAGTATAALELLPIEEREVVVLRIWSGRSFEEIAELIGMSISTAYRRFEAGLHMLRQAVSPTSIKESNDER
jgi:DNA-directed RNA polymerase specialized sigma24 family protein